MLKPRYISLLFIVLGMFLVVVGTAFIWQFASVGKGELRESEFARDESAAPSTEVDGAADAASEVQCVDEETRNALIAEINAIIQEAGFTERGYEISESKDSTERVADVVGANEQLLVCGVSRTATVRFPYSETETVPYDGALVKKAVTNAGWGYESMYFGIDSGGEQKSYALSWASGPSGDQEIFLKQESDSPQFLVLRYSMDLPGDWHNPENGGERVNSWEIFMSGEGEGGLILE